MINHIITVVYKSALLGNKVKLTKEGFLAMEKMQLMFVRCTYWICSYPG